MSIDSGNPDVVPGHEPECAAPAVFDSGGTRFRRIDSHLFQGNLRAACDHNLLRTHGVEEIISLLTPRRIGRLELPPGVRHTIFRVRDNVSPEELPLWRDAINAIVEAIWIGRRVLVHCMAGRSRSQIAVILATARLNHCSPQEAIDRVNADETILSGWNGRLMHLLAGAGLAREPAG